MPRFYLPAELHVNAKIELDERTLRHVQVLRLRVGDALTVFNGQGGEYAARLVAIEKRHAQIELVTHSKIERELPYSLTLAQCLSANEKMDWTIEKAVELGVSNIVPLNSDRSVVKVEAGKAEKKIAHWQAIVQAACEQCGRNRLPLIMPLQTLSAWLNAASASTIDSISGLHFAALATSNTKPQSLPESLRTQPAQALTLLIGSEAGFSEKELRAIACAKLIPISLGARVLRTETAGLVALSQIQAIWGDAL